MIRIRERSDDESRGWNDVREGPQVKELQKPWESLKGKGIDSS